MVQELLGTFPLGRGSSATALPLLSNHPALPLDRAVSALRAVLAPGFAAPALRRNHAVPAAGHFRHGEGGVFGGICAACREAKAGFAGGVFAYL